MMYESKVLPPKPSLGKADFKAPCGPQCILGMNNESGLKKRGDVSTSQKIVWIPSMFDEMDVKQ